MKKIISLVLMALLLSSCSYVALRKMPVEQGNVLPQDKIEQLHTGMTEAEVINLLGTPTLTNVFSPNRLDYVYTFKPGYGKEISKHVKCRFENGRLKTIIVH